MGEDYIMFINSHNPRRTWVNRIDEQNFLAVRVTLRTRRRCPHAGRFQEIRGLEKSRWSDS